MSIIGGILVAIGGIIMLVYGIIILIKAFQEHILWGLGYLFIPFCALVFIIMHWEICKRPFLKSLLGLLIYAIGFAMLAPSMVEKMDSQMQQGQASPQYPHTYSLVSR